MSVNRHVFRSCNGSSSSEQRSSKDSRRKKSSTLAVSIFLRLFGNRLSRSLSSSLKILTLVILLLFSNLRTKRGTNINYACIYRMDTWSGAMRYADAAYIFGVRIRDTRTPSQFGFLRVSSRRPSSVDRNPGTRLTFLPFLAPFFFSSVCLTISTTKILLHITPAARECKIAR